VIVLEITHYASLILQLLLPLDTCDIGNSVLAIGNHHHAQVFSNHQIWWKRYKCVQDFDDYKNPNQELWLSWFASTFLVSQ